MSRKREVNLLELVPCRAKQAITESDGGLSVIAFPRFRVKWMQKYLVPRKRSPYIRIRLEEHGSAVWELIDGTRSVGEIVSLLADHFENEPNYELRITTYMQQLYRDGLIKLLS